MPYAHPASKSHIVYTKPDPRVPLFPGSNTRTAAKHKPKPVREMRSNLVYSPNANGLNRNSMSQVYSGVQNHKHAGQQTSRASISARAQEADFRRQCERAALDKNKRIGINIAGQDPNRAYTVKHTSLRETHTTSQRGPVGEDPHHREHNQFGHNGAYRDHRWETSWGDGPDAKRQGLIDDEWRTKKNAEREEHRKNMGRPIEGTAFSQLGLIVIVCRLPQCY